MTPEQKERIRNLVADRLVEMEPLFDARCKLTFIMRSPHLADGDLLVTNDDVDAVVKALERLRTYSAVVSPDA